MTSIEVVLIELIRRNCTEYNSKIARHSVAHRDSQTNTPQDFQLESALFSLSYFFIP